MRQRLGEVKIMYDGDVYFRIYYDDGTHLWSSLKWQKMMFPGAEYIPDSILIPPIEDKLENEYKRLLRFNKLKRILNGNNK